MNSCIYPKNGEKVTFTNISGISLPGHQINTIEKYLKSGKKYVVTSIEALQYETRVYLKEFPNTYFNLNIFDEYRNLRKF